MSKSKEQLDKETKILKILEDEILELEDMEKDSPDKLAKRISLVKGELKKVIEEIIK